MNDESFRVVINVYVNEKLRSMRIRIECVRKNEQIFNFSAIMLQLFNMTLFIFEIVISMIIAWYCATFVNLIFHDVYNVFIFFNFFTFWFFSLNVRFVFFLFFVVNIWFSFHWSWSHTCVLLTSFFCLELSFIRCCFWICSFFLFRSCDSILLKNNNVRCNDD